MSEPATRPLLVWTQFCAEARIAFPVTTDLPKPPCEILAETLSRLFVCSPHGDTTRVRTPYLYPDGDAVDLFVKPAGRGGTVTDAGETVRWLRSQTLALRRTPRQTKMIADICMTLRVEFHSGMLMARYAGEGEFAEAATRVAQAAVRVSDLWLTFRLREMESATE